MLTNKDMSFNIKKGKPKKIKKIIKSIDDLHKEKVTYFTEQKLSLNKKILSSKCIVERKKSQELLEKIESDELEYFMNVSEILTEYHTINCDISKDLTEKYYKAIGIVSDVSYPRENIQTAFCLDCNTEKLLTREKFYVCTSCGISDNDKSLEGLNYDDECTLNETYVFDYKRINYFIEWLNQIQANESTEIPHEVIEDIKLELIKRNLRDTSKLSIPKVKKILKEINHSKYYEHIPLIISKLCNSKPLSLPESLITELKNMFLLIQEPFELLKNDRKNFLSYPYILYKFCEILELPQYLCHFTLLKSREKLMKTDILWKGIIDKVYASTMDPKWVFKPSC
jgi:hypothetical protein